MAQTTRLQLSGLTCGACEKVISKRLQKIEGVTEVHVSSQNGYTSIISLKAVTKDEIEHALEGTHYKIISGL